MGEARRITSYNVCYTKLLRLWKLRRSISPALRKVNPVKINEDIVVPRTRLPEMLSFLEDLASRRNLKIVNFGHAGDGNVHVNVMIEMRQH